MRNLSLFLMILASTACNACGGGGSGDAGTGGLVGTGGNASTGGVSATGGAPVGTGGVSASGGDVATGGVVSTGGNVATGGAPATGGGTGTGGGATGGESGEMEWLPSWATSMQLTEPDNNPPSPGLANNTCRQFVWPTVAGSQIRIQLSNERGNGAVQIEKVHVAKATANTPGTTTGQIDASTDAEFTFAGSPGVTIAQGDTVWSDPLDFNLEAITLTAISIKFGAQVPSDVTGHPGARTTTYVGSGDAASSASMPQGSGTKLRWYFINAIEVMAPADGYAIAMLGDSITDGYGIEDKFSRWPDFFTAKLKEDPTLASKVSVLNFGMGGNALNSSNQNQDSGYIRFGRDVLGREKIKYLVVMEGVNDLNSGNPPTPATLMGVLEDIVTEAEAAGIGVYLSPLTPMNGVHKDSKNDLNDLIRASANYDAGVDFDIAIRDPGNPNNTQTAYRNDDLHPSEAGYQAMGESVDLTLFYP